MNDAVAAFQTIREEINNLPEAEQLQVLELLIKIEGLMAQYPPTVRTYAFAFAFTGAGVAATMEAK